MVNWLGRHCCQPVWSVALKPEPLRLKCLPLLNAHSPTSPQTTVFSHTLFPFSPPFPACQAWGLLEEEQGNIEEARRLFKRASKVRRDQGCRLAGPWALIRLNTA